LSILGEFIEVHGAIIEQIFGVSEKKKRGVRGQMRGGIGCVAGRAVGNKKARQGSSCRAMG
jgi:hypothetical protein